jgi:hypothetical protein
MKHLHRPKITKPAGAKPVKKKQQLRGPKTIEKVISVNDISPV